MKQLEILIMPAPRNINGLRGRKWFSAHQEKQRIDREVFVQILRKPKFHRARIDVERVGWNKMDPTGVWESVKPILDSLVTWKVIPDDSDKHVVLGEIKQSIQRSTPPKSSLTLTLTEVE